MSGWLMTSDAKVRLHRYVEQSRADSTREQAKAEYFRRRPTKTIYDVFDELSRESWHVPLRQPDHDPCQSYTGMLFNNGWPEHR